LKELDVEQLQDEQIPAAVRASLKCFCGHEARHHSRTESSGIWFYTWCLECGMQKCLVFKLTTKPILEREP
jgi:hypothetical protein